MSSWGSFSQTYVNPENLIAAEKQVDAFMGLYNRILETCQVKCVPTDYHEPDLNKGESKCIDRCVGKYVGFQKLIAQKMEENGPTPPTSSSFSPDNLSETGN
ncbi:Tim10/DDP family zinc finger-domain-containing protein [Phycomyces blakesleeanus]|uniref:Mitochondrial import inner membrane translocase subunit n=1 Tax=Phycomyces blakesleeanus TaxID=4837 RepID=A0ABR3B4P2_PHYBL